MPVTRSAKRNLDSAGVEGDLAAPVDAAPTVRGRRGRGRSTRRPVGGRNAGRGGLQGTIGRGCVILDDDVNYSFVDDPTYEEKLTARNGCLGTLSPRGWEARTNFLIDVYALINSSRVYKLKGIPSKLYQIREGFKNKKS